jgi:hypothetical protein
MKTTKKSRKQKTRGQAAIATLATAPWMSTLAQLAAESRADDTGLKALAASAKFDLRPKMSLQKHLADDVDAHPQLFSKKHAA